MTSSTVESANIARHLPRMAAAQPDVPALKVPRGRHADGSIDYLTLTFGELETEVAAWRHVLATRGVRGGDRVLVMVRQGLPLIAGVFALFAMGAIPIVIDPGMGRKSFLACVARSRPRVLLGIPVARVLSHVFRHAFRSIELRVPASSRPTTRLASRFETSNFDSRVVASAAADVAAILFTSGSTGAPKGVCYEHGMFDAQVRLIRETYGIAPGEVDLPMLPVFALFNPALGMTTVVPEIDPSRPAQVDPARIVQAIRQERVTNSFGSPTLWWKIAQHCQTHGIALPSLKRVLCAGAPVPPALWERMRSVMPNGELHSPYGATEALPVSTIRASEVLAGPAAATRAGAGTCVGRVLAENHVKIIALTDGPLASLEDTRELPPGEIGEIIVSGPTVTKTYDALPAATQVAKIQGPSNKDQDIQPRNGSLGDTSSFPPVTSARSTVWHRMGDAGYLDGDHRLWFCGRVAERVELPDGSTLFPEQVEPIFNALPRVRRSALIGTGAPDHRQPAVVVEPVDPRALRSRAARRALTEELRACALAHPHTSVIRRFYFHRRLPVDVRHNAKIHRLALTRWAASATGWEA